MTQVTWGSTLSGWTHYDEKRLSYVGVLRIRRSGAPVWVCNHEHEGTRVPFSGELEPGVPAAATHCADKARREDAYRIAQGTVQP